MAGHVLGGRRGEHGGRGAVEAAAQRGARHGRLQVLRQERRPQGKAHLKKQSLRKQNKGGINCKMSNLKSDPWSFGSHDSLKKTYEC